MKTTNELWQVKKWNNHQKALGKAMQVYTLGGGSMFDKPRQKGWVVSYGHGSKFFATKAKAISYKLTIES